MTMTMTTTTTSAATVVSAARVSLSTLFPCLALPSPLPCLIDAQREEVEAADKSVKEMRAELEVVKKNAMKMERSVVQLCIHEWREAIQKCVSKMERCARHESMNGLFCLCTGD